jgi:D-alanyl-D-alanine carboxypeptidase
MPVLLRLLVGLLVLGTLPRGADAQEPHFQAVLDSMRSSLGAPGASAAVILSDGTVWTGASGIRAPGLPTDPETPFELGSVTKIYTAALALRLVADGVIALDDPLSRWHPDLPGAERITVEQLLNHTHGLHDPMQDPDFVPAVLQNPVRVWTLDDLLERMGEPGFPPGEGWAYSNTGFHLVGSILEHETGETLEDLFRDRLLEPLGLAGTWYVAGEAPARPLAAAFIDVTGDGSPEPVSLLMPWTAFRSSAGPAGAMIATARDAARWLHALAGGEVLDEGGWSRMTTWVERPDGNRYGLGLLRIEGENGTLIGHKGNSAGFSASAFHDPKTGITVVVLTNTHATDVTSAVEALMGAATWPRP